MHNMIGMGTGYENVTHVCMILDPIVIAIAMSYVMALCFTLWLVHP
jgi:hypothetical protein